MAGDALGSLAVLSAGAVLVADHSLEWADPAGISGGGRHHRGRGLPPAAGERRRAVGIVPRRRRPRRAHRRHGPGPRRGRGARSPRLEPVERRARPVGPRRAVRSPHARASPGRRGPGQGRHRRALHHRPQHPGARMRTLHRRGGRPVPDGQRRRRAGAPRRGDDRPRGTRPRSGAGSWSTGGCRPWASGPRVSRRATEAGVDGWVRNTEHGDVEAVFEGPSRSVDALVAWCREGPPWARVDHVEIVDEPVRGEATFRIR